MNKIILMFAFSLLLFGCIDLGGEVKNETNITNTTQPPAPVPVFTVASPINGASMMAEGNSTEVDLVLSTANLQIKQSGAKKVGEGHFQVSLDGGAYTSFYSKTYTLEDVPVGNHSLTVELVHNDGSSYSPMISKTVRFEVQSSAPAVYEPQSYTVAINDFSYEPDTITLKVSDSVTFENKGSYPRSATCFVLGKQLFDTGVLGPGASSTITFDQKTSCEFYSVTYPSMKGNLVVEENTTG